MKTRFNTYDIVCCVTELKRLIGMRVNQIYDIDHKTYLIRLQKGDDKVMLLLESGSRIHTTAFEWPKNVAPSGFSMKMRKHLKNKRLENLSQIGVDRMIDLCFGSGEAAYHVILELYDRGNIVLTDYEMTIINILRPHTEGDKIRLAVKEKYPAFRAHTKVIPLKHELEEIIKNAKSSENLKKILNPHLEVGAAVIDHVLLEAGFVMGCKIDKDFNRNEDFEKLYQALKKAEEMFCSAKLTFSKGYIIHKKELKPVKDGEDEYMYANIEFHPYLFKQYESQPFKEYDTFDKAVDEYYSTMEGQKLDLKFLQQEREAIKKLSNVKKDHDQRLISLTKTQEQDMQKAELITRNQELVDNAILAIQSALANQMPWEDIQILLEEAKCKGDPVASAIKQLKLQSNHISLLLSDPYEESELPTLIVDIDLAYSAFANARKYYDQKRSAAKKQQKTIESQGKALKSAERKTKQTLKEVQAIHSINKARKVYWFEKFYWFISSENYLVIGGRDQQQNELIVKRYLKTGDLYVHADLTGASSLVVKNPTNKSVPPKTLAEAGTMAVAYSIAWEAKVVAGAWWVNSDQVSKTAPSGEYLTTGSFMIRGKKNYLPVQQLVVGLGILFRLEDSFIEKHRGERRVRTIEEEQLVVSEVLEECKEIELPDDDDDDDDREAHNNLQTIDEEITKGDENDAKIEHSSDNENEDEEPSLFPDTQFKLNITGSKVKLSINDGQPDIHPEISKKDDFTITEASSHRSKKNVKTSTKEEEPQCNEHVKQNQTTGLKRGQRGKLKKMKEKYKDQDEEDRKLLMAVLQSAGVAKEDKKKSKNKNTQRPSIQDKKKFLPMSNPVQTVESFQSADNIEDEDAGPNFDVDMLDQLTGKPLPDDELLFIVPVIAPYSTLQTYKFKVKLTPGFGKRGKAVKTAVDVFLKDKSITQREKDLLKAVKPDLVSRNIPGKVKISAPQIQKVKK